jgi:hypothetical protein
MRHIKFNNKSYPKLLLSGLAVLFGLSSCVPLAIGAVGAAAGYIARDQGVGVIAPVESDSPDSSYDSYDPALY